MFQKTGAGFDVIIVGAGPAGIFCAYELKQLKPDLDILILEKGKRRPIDDKNNNLFGFGGAGAFSDGKLTLTSKTGGQLTEKNEKGEYEYLTPEGFNELLRYVESLYEKFGGKQELKIGKNAEIAALIRRANAVGLELIPYPLKHWGREGAYKLVEGLFEYLKKSGVQIRLSSEVISIEREGAKFGPASPQKWQVFLRGGEMFLGNSLVLATGRAGADWTVQELKKHGVKTGNNPADVGVRMEVKKSMIEDLTDNLYDFKLIYLTPKRRDRVRTFCVCPAGRVVKEQHSDFTAVNGQTDKNDQTENTNFAILVSASFTEPFKDANAFGRDIARLGTLLSNGSVLVQTLSDWQNERRSKPQSLKNFPVISTLPDAAPGDLRLALPERIFAGINEIIEAMGKFIPGLNNGNNALLYGVEVKFYSRKVVFKKGFETSAGGLYVVGDGSGVTRGLAQSSIMGVKAAREIVKN
ncbi:MAG: FAD-dependent oxidoreductase [Candidatus Nealsonbacteria bacterium]|nr:FAD-dependent oxidoreductase [Candidatus Nealsonbacteria bacterium]